MENTKKLQWTLVEGLPHSHLTNQRVLRIVEYGSDHVMETWGLRQGAPATPSAKNRFILQLLTNSWEDLLCVETGERPDKIERLKDYAEFLFIGNRGI